MGRGSEAGEPSRAELSVSRYLKMTSRCTSCSTLSMQSPAFDSPLEGCPHSTRTSPQHPQAEKKDCLTDRVLCQNNSAALVVSDPAGLKMCHSGWPTCAARLWLCDEAPRALALKAAMHVVVIRVLIGQFPQDDHLTTFRNS